MRWRWLAVICAILALDASAARAADGTCAPQGRWIEPGKAKPAETEQILAWSEARRQKLADRLPWLLALNGALLVLVLAAARRQPDWVLAILGLGFVVFAFQMTNYYYVLLLPFALLWPRHRSVGLALIAAVLASHWLRGRWVDPEEFFTRSSAVAVLFVAYATAVVHFARGARAEAAALQAPG